MSSSSLNPSARTFIPPPAAGTTTTTNDTSTSVRTFPQMLNLQEELILYILSFVSDVPYESSSDANESTLTHVIPLVCKKFLFQYAKSDYLWKGALIRLVTHEPLLWGHGVKSFTTSYPAPVNIQSNQEDDDDYHATSNDGDNDNDIITAASIRLVTDAGESMKRILQTNQNYGYFSNRHNNSHPQQTNTTRPIFCELYRYVLFNQMRFTSPLFYMPDNIHLGQEFGLHFFEPRYRLLIAQVMAPYPNYVNGEPIRIKSNKNSGDDNHELPWTYPSFIYANKSPLTRGTTACIVQVRQCVIHANSTADVYLNPVSYAKIEDVWVRPNSHNLYEARVFRMNSKETKAVIDQSNNMFIWPAPSGGARRGGRDDDDDDNIDSDNDDNDDGNDDNNNRDNSYIDALLLQLMAASNRQRNNHRNNENEQRG